MNTTSNQARIFFKTNIGGNNKNLNVFMKDQQLLEEISRLRVENESLKGLLQRAVDQLQIKDQLIKIFSKRWIK